MPSLGVTLPEALAVVLSAVGIYMALLLLLRVVGQRAVASMSSFDFAAAVAIGAVMGRAILGSTPTLLAGVIGLATLFAMQVLFGLVRRGPRLQDALNNPPILLIAHGRLLRDNMRRAHVVEDELREQLRLSGVRRYEDVACMILERTGAVSVLLAGAPISQDLLADVHGASELWPGPAPR